MSSAVGSRWNLSLDLLEWAGAETKLGNHLVAGQALYELLGLIGESGNRSELAAALGVVAHVLAELGDPDTAVFALLARRGIPDLHLAVGVGSSGLDEDDDAVLARLAPPSDRRSWPACEPAPAPPRTTGSSRSAGAPWAAPSAWTPLRLSASREQIRLPFGVNPGSEKCSPSCGKCRKVFRTT